MSARRPRFLFSCLASLAIGLAAHGQALVDDARLGEAAAAPADWLAHGRTWSEQRFSPLAQVDEGNVAKLAPAWVYATGETRGLEATPLVADGVMYTTLPWSIVVALDAATGRELWRYDPAVPKAWGRNACCDVVNRGVALYAGRVYVGTLDGRLVALDAKTGAEVWQMLTIDPAKPYTITGAPRVAKGLVFIGNGGAEFGVRGYVSAYAAETGALVWRFYTVPGPPDRPREHPALELAAKSWPADAIWESGLGGTVWDSIAYDPALDLLYVGVGNSSPYDRRVRSPGGGDNLFLASILALRAQTGELAWHYQTTPGENWDYTATQHMILAELELGGRTRRVLMQAPKNGFFYVLDRATGELLSAEPYGTVSWASHVDLDDRPPRRDRPRRMARGAGHGDAGRRRRAQLAPDGVEPRRRGSSTSRRRSCPIRFSRRAATATAGPLQHRRGSARDGEQHRRLRALDPLLLADAAHGLGSGRAAPGLAGGARLGGERRRARHRRRPRLPGLGRRRARRVPRDGRREALGGARRHRGDGAADHVPDGRRAVRGGDRRHRRLGRPQHDRVRLPERGLRDRVEARRQGARCPRS